MAQPTEPTTPDMTLTTAEFEELENLIRGWTTNYLARLPGYQIDLDDAVNEALAVALQARRTYLAKPTDERLVPTKAYCCSAVAFRLPAYLAASNSPVSGRRGHTAWTLGIKQAAGSPHAEEGPWAKIADTSDDPEQALHDARLSLRVSAIVEELAAKGRPCTEAIPVVVGGDRRRNTGVKVSAVATLRRRVRESPELAELARSSGLATSPRLA